MNNNELWNNILISVKNSYSDAIIISNSIADSEKITPLCASAMRITIEGLVKLFYLKFYRKTFDSSFKLGKSIKNDDFRRYFKVSEYADIDLIRFVGNEQMHFMFGENISVKRITRIFNSAVKALQEKLDINIMETCSECEKNYVPIEQNLCDTDKNINTSINKDNKGIVTPYSLKAGDRIDVSKNYELLNMLLGKQLKGYMSSIYKLQDDDKFIWMIKLDGIKRQGWKNSWFPDKIVEEYLDGPPFPSNISIGYNIKKRIVFEKYGDGRTQYFIFRGVYQMEKDSTLTYRVLRIVSEEISF